MFLTMKARRKLEAVLDALNELKRLFFNDKILCEVYEEVGKMTRGILDSMVERKN